jgi:hypothetical protein
MDQEDLSLFKAKAQAELNRLEAESTAKEVAGKAAQVWLADDKLSMRAL